MINFYQAIYTHFSKEPHNEFYNLVGGRFSYGEAEQGCASPYAVYFGVASGNEDTFQETIDDESFQVNVYANTAAEAMRAAKACRGYFDGAVLVVPSSRDVTLDRELITPPMKNGDEWMASIGFNTLIQEGE